MTAPSDVVFRVIERLAFIGVTPSDTGEVRDRKVTLTLAAMTVTGLAVIWVGTYLALGLPVPAAIPSAYQVAAVASLAYFARTKDYRFFWTSQLVIAAPAFGPDAGVGQGVLVSVDPTKGPVSYAGFEPMPADCS